MYGGLGVLPKPGCSSTSTSQRSASVLKKAFHGGTPPAPCRKMSTGPRPARQVRARTSRVSSVASAGAMRQYRHERRDSMKLISIAAAAVIIFATAAAAQDVRIGNATANDTQAAANDKFAELISKYSNGKLQATAHHGSSLGTIAQMVRALQAGSVHGMIFPAGFLSPVIPELAMFDLPFLLPGAPAEITRFAAQSKAAELMKHRAAEKGIVIVAFHGIGPQSFLTKFPVAKLADLQGKKIRVIPSPPRIGAYQDWGAVARPMELGEVYTALQQGTIDGLENPPDVIYKMKLYEAAKYYTITEHFAFVSNLIYGKSWHDGLP